MPMMLKTLFKTNAAILEWVSKYIVPNITAKNAIPKMMRRKKPNMSFIIIFLKFCRWFLLSYANYPQEFSG